MDLGFPITGTTVLGVDNTAAIDITRNYGVTQRNKHYVRETHYIREQYDRGVVAPLYVDTLKQRADFYTKPLDPTKFMECRKHHMTSS